MKLLLDLTTTTFLEHRNNHAATDKDYVTDQFDSDEGDNYEDDDDKDLMNMTTSTMMKIMMITIIMMMMTTLMIMSMLLLLLQLMFILENLDDYAETIIMIV
ncbi:hypothetical protein PoB_005540500 [Plakobranchus ocellatus]|uniref:Uncharacterized protein n=1 Tax=Plakobranchus ocellatus TaxID=259542 RepID=A0AAV4C851_9GAST|nr:hypothetical protein PoB_005540500 [Plakobranchus ocellatus]